MQKVFITLLIITAGTIAFGVPMRDESNKDYIIFGSNSVQKLYYATDSRFSENHDGMRALDSDTNSSWVSKKNNTAHWIEIDFGVKRMMSTIVISPGKVDNYNTIRYFSLQFLYENKWFDFARIDCETKSNKYLDTIEIDTGGIDASSFRIFIPADATYNGQAAVSEISVYLGANKIKYYDERLMRLIYPIKNGFLPASDAGFPNAPRGYRGGTHAGLDVFQYYEDDNYTPKPITKKNEILAADNGIIIRADLDYKPMTANEWKNESAFYSKNPSTFVRRSFGGRQVWIDHGNGIVTAYNHMSSIADGLKKGTKVKKGDVIGHCGNSGLLGEAEGKDWGVHLHFEIWVDGYYLGYGMKPNEVRKYVTWIFGQHQ